jgi:hypothetical protein
VSSPSTASDHTFRVSKARRDISPTPRRAGGNNHENFTRSSRLPAHRGERHALRYESCCNSRYEHTDMCHAGLKLSNMMLSVGDESVFKDYKEAGTLSPSQSKTISPSRRLYTSRYLRTPNNHVYSPPLLCDFGEARVGSDHAHVDIQPEIYNGPEVLMETGWTYSVDIWNAACLVYSFAFFRPCVLY